MTGNGHEPRIDNSDSYPLDDATIALFDETLQQIRTLNAYREGVLGLFMRQHGLTVGEWKLGANGKELVRAPQAQPIKTT